MNDLYRERANRIRAATETAWSEADIPELPAVPRIVPLDKLIAAFSLGASEVAGLTRGSAARFLSARSGQAIPPSGEADAALAGYLYACPVRGGVFGYMLVEQNDIVERRRFSAAHELGHYLLHFLPAIQAEQARGQHLTMTEGLTYSTSVRQDAATPDGAVMFGRGAEPQRLPLPDEIVRMEVEANQFAAELLMPEAACLALVQRFGERASPRRLATEFLVSPAAMRWRLAELVEANW